MNQTKKRLSIIKLAISITDIETIQLQVLKLGLLRTDTKIQEIITALNNHSYVKAQRLISDYIENHSDKIIQRIFQEKEEIPKEIKKEKTIEAIIEEFELFKENIEEEQKINYDTYLDIASKPTKMSTKTINTIDYDSLLNMEVQDILSDNITLDISHSTKDTFFNEEPSMQVDKISEDAFFDTVSEAQEQIVQKTIIDKKSDQEKIAEVIEDDFFQIAPDIQTPKINTAKIKQNNSTKDKYKAIVHIERKFKNMYNQYPPTNSSNDHFPSIDTWIRKISQDGYTEAEVEQMLKDTEKLSKSNKSEAAQLLLITASTESKYAQFILARALYSGEILQKNLPDAFTFINRLAINDNYPEAICDLAQLYENGIGTDRDKKKAEELYKEAMNLGIRRAIHHYQRIQKQNRGFFSFFNK